MTAQTPREAFAEQIRHALPAGVSELATSATVNNLLNACDLYYTAATSPQPPARASYLSPPDFHRLDWACRPVTAAFDTPVYLVGSVLTRADYRDIDLRLILDDDEAANYPPPLRLVLNVALSDLIAKLAGLPRPIDFQIQSMTEANAEDGARNPLGIPGIGGRL
ncbi:hypothetical protein BX265_6149 [Streptomyces sp. TLI_235]|nr:hypothetical protein [Streptomyces sp. TLI_235]PBC71539.1 hypothetical protein BX265_6149 [Streptomyces sp. TLI_235]